MTTCWYWWHLIPSQPSSLPSPIRANPQQQLIHQVKPKTLDATISSSGITLNLHPRKKIKSQISRIPLVGEILAYIKRGESKNGHRWWFYFVLSENCRIWSSSRALPSSSSCHSPRRPPELHRIMKVWHIVAELTQPLNPTPPWKVVGKNSAIWGLAHARLSALA